MCQKQPSSISHIVVSYYSVESPNERDACMPIVYILVNGISEIYCLLDTGSTSTYVTTNSVSKLSLPTKSTNSSFKTSNYILSR